MKCHIYIAVAYSYQYLICCYDGACCSVLPSTRLRLVAAMASAFVLLVLARSVSMVYWNWKNTFFKNEMKIQFQIWRGGGNSRTQSLLLLTPPLLAPPLATPDRVNLVCLGKVSPMVRSRRSLELS